VDCRIVCNQQWGIAREEVVTWREGALPHHGQAIHRCVLELQSKSE
jgi:hypothetical protein